MTSDKGNGPEDSTASDVAGTSERSLTSSVHTHLLLRRKFWAISGGSLLFVIVVALFGVVWFYSSEIQSGAFEIDHSEDEFKLWVSDISDTSISLVYADTDDKPDSPGQYGLESKSGAFGHLNRILGEGEVHVVRGFEPFNGTFKVGDNVRVERSAFPGDPRKAFGIEYSEVLIDSPLGPMPAWSVPGDSATWAIMVHGRTSSREETLRALGITNLAGLPVLSISYRNDEDAPRDPSGEYGFGTTEWPDLEAAVEYALANGAENIVLFGFSMGGGVVAQFMIESALFGAPVGLVLDAPMLNLTNALELAGEQRGLPLWLPWLAANLSRVRFGTDWESLDTREEMLEMQLPILLFHGTGDETIPVSQSDSFVEEAGDNVTYVRVEDAEHVGAWNVDPAAYETALEDWLDEVVGK